MSTAAKVLELQGLLQGLRQRRELLGPGELQARRPGQLQSGLAELDALLGGGLPRGRVVELAPGAGGAATAVAVLLLARLTAEGHPAALCDLADAFDPRSAEQAGVVLPRLLWCRPRSAREAVRAADALLACGAFPLVVLDLNRPRASGPQSRPAEASWLRLSRRAEVARCTLLVLADGQGGAGPLAAATLQASGARARFSGRGPGRTFEGLELTLRLVRNKLGLPPRSTQLLLAAPARPQAVPP